MKQERPYLIALIVIALLASIPQIPVQAQVWAAILAIVGIVAGLIVRYDDLVQRILIYVLAVALPTFDNAVGNVWVVGPWLNTLLDNVAVGIQGSAIGLFVMALAARIQGARPATS